MTCSLPPRGLLLGGALGRFPRHALPLTSGSGFPFNFLLVVVAAVFAAASRADNGTHTKRPRTGACIYRFLWRRGVIFLAVVSRCCTYTRARALSAGVLIAYAGAVVCMLARTRDGGGRRCAGQGAALDAGLTPSDSFSFLSLPFFRRFLTPQGAVVVVYFCARSCSARLALPFCFRGVRTALFRPPHLHLASWVHV